MSNKSGTSDQVISLPKGGGALHGMGEKFAPDLHTGTGNFTVPIALPPGRNGFQPQLNLVYSTGNPNGYFGLGWSLSIPGVSRKTSRGIPRYQDAASHFDERDTFILSGAEDLVAIQDSEAETGYRPRTEGLFAQIVHHHSAGTQDNYWEVHSKDGLVSVYGTPGGAGSDSAAAANPSAPDQVFAWKLTETRDPFENRIRYLYGRDQGRRDGHTWDQPSLQQICYADYSEQDQLRFLVWVTFEYEERNDEFSDYRAGFEMRTTQRCKAIHVEIHADQVLKVRRYSFDYQEDPWNGVSLLQQIAVAGYDDQNNAVQELPPLSFAYSQFAPQRQRFLSITGSELPPASLAHPDYELADLTGDGLPDILEMNGTVRYWRNLGNGTFDLPRPMRDAPAGLALADVGVQLIDADGDGRIDLLASKDGLFGYFPLRFDAIWDRRSFRRYESAPSFNLEDPEVKLVDLDGDGVPDVIRSGTRLECFFNDRRSGWNGRTRWLERRGLDDFPNVNFSDSRVKWGDMTGDGLQDIVLVYDGNVEYWPNLGHGNWGKRLHMRNSPRFPYGYDPKRILLGDVDGDGLADIVYVDDTRVLLWINRSGNAWSEQPTVIEGTPPVTDMDAVRLVDMLGSGISGVLWSADATINSRKHMYFLDFTGGIKPYLLHEMDNHLGAVTKVEYAPSTRYCVQDAVSPKTRWKTPLPFPVHVVARVEVIDDLSWGKLTTEYSYHHGYWDGAEREFRGFGMVEQFDTETFELYKERGLHGEAVDFSPVASAHFSPPTHTKTWFHQGPVGDEYGGWDELKYEEFWEGDPQLLERPQEVRTFLGSLPRRVKRDALRALRGKILRTELFALDDADPGRLKRPYTVTETLYGVCEVVASNNGLSANVCAPQPGDSAEKLGDDVPQRIFFPHVLAQRTTRWERGEDAMTQFTFTGEYDDFGQPQHQTSVAMPRRSANRHSITGALVGQLQPDETSVLATHTWTTYAQPQGGAYIHDRVAQVKLYTLGNPHTVNENKPEDVQAVLRDHALEAQAVRDLFIAQHNVRLIGHTLNHYDGPSFEGLPVGNAGKYGALTRSESLFFTEELLNAAFQGDPNMSGRRPAYLDGPQQLPTGAPPNFGANAGYRRMPASGTYNEGYYADTRRQQLDFQVANSRQQRGVILALQDALQYETQITLDTYWLLPEKVTDPVKLTTTVQYNYRMMQPEVVIDANGNQTHYRYHAVGLPHRVWLESNGGQGGTEDKPELEYRYDFLHYENSKSADPQNPQPIYVHTTARVHHASDNISDETIETIEYSDGFGRPIQKRTQAEEVAFGTAGDDVGLLVGGQALPGQASLKAVAQRDINRVVVSGWQVYDNKGRVVEKYEPFFDKGWDYQPEKDAKQGKPVTMFYDPRGQVIRTVNPDGSEQRVIVGVPGTIANPELAKVNTRREIEYEPSAWESYTYDPNDLAPVSQDADSGISLTGRAPASHYYTPASTLVDGLGRVICTVERNGSDPTMDWYITRSRYDVRGNLLEVRDALGRPAFKHAYDLLNRQLRVDSIDAGLRTWVLDAQGNLLEYRDSKGSIVLREYDELNRLVDLWAIDDARAAQQLALREKIIYGDKANLPDAAARNLLGKPYLHYDEAGKLTFDRYDFKGNLAQKARRVVKDQAIAGSWTADWQGEPPDESDLEPPASAFETSTTFDALNRPTSITYPKDINGHAGRLTPTYDRAGALQAVKLEDDTYVEHIAYNARGQRVLIAYGNGVMTRYSYDPRTFRLIRLRTEKCSKPDDLSWQSAQTGTPKDWLFQDFTYAYDLAGNITAIQERTPESGLSATPNQLARAFTYDPIYRLVSASGREYAAPRPQNIWDDVIYPADPTKTAPYTQTYGYDPAGNLSKLIHTAADTVNSYTKRLDLEPNQNGEGSNRLQSVTVGSDVYAYQYDNSGNIVQETLSRFYSWDHADRMTGFKIQNGAGVSVDARYLYGADGMRVKKWVQTNGTGVPEITVFIDGIFEYHRWKKVGQPTSEENNRLHVMDNQGRIAIRRIGDADDQHPDVQYQLGDHLGSSNVVIGGTTASDYGLINREEYFPYGETSFGSFGKKRYRFTGKERDQESGLYYYGARYYDPGIGRFLVPDTVTQGLSPQTLNCYSYVLDTPLKHIDPSGHQAELSPGMRAALEKNREYRERHPEEQRKYDLYNAQVREFGLPESTRIENTSAPNSPVAKAVADAEALAKAAYWAAMISLAIFGVVLLVELAPTFFSFGNQARLVLRNGWTAVRRWFWDPRTFSTVSREYWRESGGAMGRNLHHWLFQNQSTWIWQGLRNAGFNLLELPAGLNNWGGGVLLKELTIRAGVLSVLGLTGYGSYKVTSNIAGGQSSGSPSPSGSETTQSSPVQLHGREWSATLLSDDPSSTEVELQGREWSATLLSGAASKESKKE